MQRGLRISDIKKLTWHYGEDSSWKWHDTELCLRAFGRGRNPLVNLFGNIGLDVLVVNTSWFYSEDNAKPWETWGRGKQLAIEKGPRLLTRLVAEEAKYIKRAERTVKTVQATRRINLKVLQEIKEALLSLSFIFNCDLGDTHAPYLENYIRRTLKTRGLLTNQINAIVDYCFTPSKLLALQKEQEDLRRIALYYRRKYGFKVLTSHHVPQDIQRLLTTHWKRFCWLNYYVELDSTPFSFEYFLQDLCNLLETKQGKRGKEFTKNKVSLKNVDLETKRSLKLIKRHISLDNYAADLYGKLVFFMAELISKKYGISFQDLTWYSFEELETLVRNGTKLNASQLRKRRQFRAMVQIHGEIEFFYSKKDVSRLTSLVRPAARIPHKVTEISGVGVSRGVRKGSVKIVRKSKDLRKVQEGDILVAPMTNPDFMPAIRRCAAIVTDQGGITCHAAIVARELKIPCICGTQIATQVLKDGDLVAVDANRGTVRILKA